MKTDPTSRISLARAPFVGAPADWGRLRAPLHHADPDGPELELPFVRLDSRAAKPGPPLIFLTGGPGLSGIRSGEGRLFPMFDGLRETADVILLDQRACVRDDKPAHASVTSLFPDDRLITRDEYLRVIAGTVRETVDTLKERGVPVDALNTVESADDVALLARSLYGEDVRVSLLGWSYGSHLAMAIIKRHESLVASAVLAAPEGPDQTLKRPSRIQAYLERIAGHARAEMSGFDMMKALENVLTRVANDPVTVTIYSDRFYEGPPIETVLGCFDLEWIFSEAVSDSRSVRDLPVWIQKMERGDFSILGSERLMRNAWRELRHDIPYSVARYAMDCASGATQERLAMIEKEARETLLGRTIDFPLPDICEAVGCPDLGDEFRSLPDTAVPTLFITGSLDCRTPAENVTELAPGFSNHEHVTVEGAGHGDLLLHNVSQEAIKQFVRSPGGTR